MKTFILILGYFLPLSISAQIFDSAYFDCHYFETGICADSKVSKPQAFLYPNPTVDVLTLDIKNSETTEGLITNVAGQYIKRVSFRQGFTFDVSELAQSLYFLRLLPSGIVLKFVKL